MTSLIFPVRKARPPVSWWALPGVICACLLTACGSPPQADPLRLLSEESAEELDIWHFAETGSVFEWTFRQPAEMGHWQCIEASIACRIENGALHVRSDSSDPRLVRKVTFPAANVDVLEVELARPISGPTAVYWAAPGEPFSNERMQRLTPADRSDSGRVLLETVLSEHPLWTGDIGRLRLDPTNVADESVWIAAIRGVHSKLPTSRLEELAAKPWVVEVDDEVRRARVAPGGHPVIWPVRVPRGRELRLAYGVVPGPRQSEGDDGEGTFVFRVRVQDSSTQGEILLEERLAAARGPHRWVDRRIDLSALGGRQIELVFETEPVGSPSGVPVWSHPELVAMRRPRKPPNVLLISIDTLRGDRLSINGYERETTPHLDAWIRRSGVNFTNAISPAPITLPSHVSLFTGLNPLHHGLHYQAAIPADTSLLAERLHRAGMATAAITGGVLVHPKFGFDRGFDRYFYWAKQAPSGEEELESGIERALTFLEESVNRPFFLFFHTYEVHWPYRERQPYYDRFATSALADGQKLGLRPLARTEENGFATSYRFFVSDSGEGTESEMPQRLSPILSARYDSGVAFADHQIGRLLARVDELGLADETLIVVTSDHGESLGEENRASHYHLREENLKIPLMISLPGVLPEGKTIEDQVALIDILPTVLDLVGLEVPADIDGVSLAPLMRGERAGTASEVWSYAPSMNRGVSLRVDNRLKYIFNNAVWDPIAREEQLYDLRTDPAELNDLSDERAGELDRLRQQVQGALAEVPGLRLSFRNESEGVVSGSIRGHVGATTVKSFAVPRGALRFERAGLVHYSLGPGESYLLTIEYPGEGRFAIEASWTAPADPDGAVHQWTVEMSSLEEPRMLFLDEDGWSESEGVREDVEVAVVAWRQGDTGLTSFEQDERLRRDLRALGYIE